MVHPQAEFPLNSKTEQNGRREILKFDWLSANNSFVFIIFFVPVCKKS